MKLEWKNFKEGDFFRSADCGPISLDIDKNDEDGSWSFWIDEIGDDGFETYETEEKAIEAAESFAVEFAQSILNGLDNGLEWERDSSDGSYQAVCGGITIEVREDCNEESDYPGAWFYYISELSAETPSDEIYGESEAKAAASQFAREAAHHILDALKWKQ